MTGLASQNWPFEEHRLNGCFLIRRPTLRDASVNGRFWPKAAI
jgi:hypothetical protein